MDHKHPNLEARINALHDYLNRINALFGDDYDLAQIPNRLATLEKTVNGIPDLNVYPLRHELLMMRRLLALITSAVLLDITVTFTILYLLIRHAIL